jgi:cell wall-associated NlpC family hydrolase
VKTNWERTVYDCMCKVNQLEIEQRTDPLSDIVEDDRYFRTQKKRLNAVMDGDRTRGIQRQKNELRLKVIDVKREKERIHVHCRARRKLWYQLGDQTYAEERLEKYRLTLTETPRSLDQWKVSFLTQDDDEENTTRFVSGEASGFVASEDAYALESAKIHSAWDTDVGQAKRPSVPYLHSSLRPAQEKRKIRYNREAVRRYADTWWDYPNPDYIHFQVDCTNFVSQCLYAGGVPMDYTGKRDRGWWYRKQNGKEAWSFSWSVAHSLYWYLSNPRSVFRARQVESPQLLDIGDVIFYDWEGNGRFGHSTIVTGHDADGMPLVNAHTSNSKRRYWDYRDSTAWTENTRYRFFHIPDWL